MKKIYLDNNGTTGLDPRVFLAMQAELGTTPANPSSIHFFGQEARNRLRNARQTISDALGTLPSELIFTSGGTESINTLLKSLPLGHIITSNIEHSCIYNTLQTRENVSYLPAGLWGAVKPEQVANALQPGTCAIVLAAVNNETGVKTDIEAIGALAKEANIPFIVDGVALLGKEPFAIPHGVSAMAFSGHKLHGPKGVGLTFVRNCFKLAPLLIGGDQEFGRRAGTENLPGIIGLAKAIELLATELPTATPRMRALQERLETGLSQSLGPIVINGEGPRIVNTSNISFPHLEGETLLIALDMVGIAVSHGSACASGALEPSRILQNMGIPKTLCRSAIRFSLSRWTTPEEIDACIAAITAIAASIDLSHKSIS